MDEIIDIQGDSIFMDDHGYCKYQPKNANPHQIMKLDLWFLMSIYNMMFQLILKNCLCRPPIGLPLLKYYQIYMHVVMLKKADLGPLSKAKKLIPPFQNYKTIFWNMHLVVTTMHL